MLNFCDFIQVFVFTRNHHLNYDPYEYEYFSKCTFYVVTHVSHTSQIIYSTHPYQAIKISLFTTPQWPHILGQQCNHRQCRPRLDKGLHYLPYRPYFKCLQHHNDRTYQPYLYGLSCEFTSPHWPCILGQGCMHKQHRPRIRTICLTICIFNIYFGFTSPKWPNILGQKSMCKQHRPKFWDAPFLSVITLRMYAHQIKQYSRPLIARTRIA